MNRFTTLVAIGLLVSSLILSGCGSFATSIVKIMVNDHEFSQDKSLCEKRCSSFKDDKYAFCYRKCMTEQTVRRKREKEEAEEKDSGPAKAELDNIMKYRQK